jgi:hypothetical protein
LRINIQASFVEKATIFELIFNKALPGGRDRP